MDNDRRGGNIAHGQIVFSADCNIIEKRKETFEPFKIKQNKNETFIYAENFLTVLVVLLFSLLHSFFYRSGVGETTFS